MTPSTDPLLQCRSVTVRFGGVTALDGVDFDVAPGSITAIIGPNGAGKTTLLNAVTGLAPVSAGAIAFAGKDLTRMPPHARGLAGVVRTFQNLQIFTNMTVLENVLTGAHRSIRYNVVDAMLRTPRFHRAEHRAKDRAVELLDFVGLSARAEDSAGELPFGGQRMLEIARALAAEPELLLLDEPAAGLNMAETRGLGGLMRRIREELHVTVALVEHDMDLVMGVSDVLTVLHFGRVLARGGPRQVQEDPAVVEAYLGGPEEEQPPTPIWDEP